jgi:transcriptional regulator with XRE-family HTH domain
MKTGKQKNKMRVKVERSSGNVFFDLGLDEPDVLLQKAEVIVQIRLAMEERGLTVEATANLLGIPPTELTAIFCGDPAELSLPYLEKLLTVLRASESASETSPAQPTKKAALSDGSGNWFDLNSAKVWEDRISDHENSSDGPHTQKLYLTEKGTFILCSWHWWLDNMEPLYLPIDQEMAVRWLVANGYKHVLCKLELQPEERKLEV